MRAVGQGHFERRRGRFAGTGPCDSIGPDERSLAVWADSGGDLKFEG